MNKDWGDSWKNVKGENYQCVVRVFKERILGTVGQPGGMKVVKKWGTGKEMQYGWMSLENSFAKTTRHMWGPFKECF